jgi:hypothetical protein
MAQHRIKAAIALIATHRHGVGGDGRRQPFRLFANPDWLVRDAVLADLTYSDWPPSYQPFATASTTCCVPRSASSCRSRRWASCSAWNGCHGWSTPGPHAGTVIFLLLLPLPGRLGGRLLAALAIVILFSGMDILGILIVHGQWPIFPLRLEWWTRFS